ncbi:MAG TPA: ferritin family protein [Bacteroidales bacterium]|nr:ferritin family protein [Bacteroidales bacterium]
MYYSGQEIIEIAVRIEENGYAFYNAAAEMIKDQSDIRDLFLDLAEKELHHIAAFRSLAGHFEAEKFEFNQREAEDYISHLAGTHIFGIEEAGVLLAKAVKTPMEALEIALRFENDSVTFYEELYKRTESDAKNLIHQIIEEEKSHAALIRKFL